MFNFVLFSNIFIYIYFNTIHYIPGPQVAAGGELPAAVQGDAAEGNAGRGGRQLDLRHRQLGTHFFFLYTSRNIATTGRGNTFID